MCFKIHKKHPKAKTAKRKIYCYKILQHDCICTRSPYRHTPYVFVDGECKKDESAQYFLTLIPYDGFIDKGLHSYSSKDKASTETNVWLFPDELVHRAYIPKGAKYYYNPEKEEYVSNQLIVLEETI